MTKFAIELDNVGKAYSGWGGTTERFWSLVGFNSAIPHPMWALSDISLNIPRGMAIGILGRNGAGKSTLLQLIAGTIQPTVGYISRNGRVSPLLELGAGFNPEFSGWENAQLAGTILGLPSSQMSTTLKAIADFADIGAFMGKPVKTYSSGMFARLAFSVAVHVDPEILLVDEILSVGDMGFQHRCLARLREMRARGLTLVFVSHSPDAVKSVCTHALFLDQGRAVFFGSADDAVVRYLAFIRERANAEQLIAEREWGPTSPKKASLPATLRYGTGHAQIRDVQLKNESGEPCRAFALGDQISLDVQVESTQTIANLSVSFVVRDSTGVDIFGTTTFDERIELPEVSESSPLKIRFRFPNCLRPGNYGISVAVNRVSRRDYTDNVVLDQLEGVIAFMVPADPNRPVHYKIYQAIDIRVADG